MTKFVTIEQGLGPGGRIAVVRFDRGDGINALSPEALRQLTDAARTHLVRTGYNPTYGARPLKRAIQKEVETQLARLILKGEVRDGQSRTERAEV